MLVSERQVLEGLGASVVASVPDTELILRVWDEVPKHRFIALPGQGGHNGLVPSKLCPGLPWWRSG